MPKYLTKKLKKKFADYRKVLKNPQISWPANVYLWLAIFRPMDDIVINPILLDIALLFTPKVLIQSCLASLES